MYWANNATELAFISTCPLTGCAGLPRVLVRDQYGVSAIVTDDKAIYWSNKSGGNIVRLAK